MKHKNKSTLDINVLLVAGLIILTASLLWRKHEYTKLSFVPSNLDVSYVTDIAQQPNHIEIQSTHISLPVKETVIHKGIWTVSEDAVSHLHTSANPKSEGNIILYAHNTADKFGNLHSVKHGDAIVITTKDNKKHMYRVYKTVVVRPSQVEVLQPENPEELTVYTCYGFADLQRFVVKAVPVI